MLYAAYNIYLVDLDADSVLVADMICVGCRRVADVIYLVAFG